MYSYKKQSCAAVWWFSKKKTEIGNRPCLQHIPSRMWNLLRRLEHRLAGRVSLQQVFDRSIREQGAGGNQSPGRGEWGGDSRQNSSRMNGAGKALEPHGAAHGPRDSSAHSTPRGQYRSPREANIDAAITQIALDIKQHRDVQKGRDPSIRGSSAHSTPREANIDARSNHDAGSKETYTCVKRDLHAHSNHDAGSELKRAVSHELDLKYMVSAISADAAALSQRAAQVSSLLSPRSQGQAHGGGRGGGGTTRDERKPPLPPRICQQEREIQQKSALKHTPANNHTQPHSTSLTQAPAYASRSEVHSSPRSHVTFKGKTRHMFVRVYACEDER